MGAAKAGQQGSMSDTPNLQLPYIEAAQAQKHVTHNEALRNLDALVQLSIADRDLASPPASPNDGDRYLVASGASGDWAGKENLIAAWQDGAWQFHTPRTGWLIWVVDEESLLVFDGTAFVAPPLQNVSWLGVNTAADSSNRLAVRPNQILLTALNAADSGDGNVLTTLNKETAGDDAGFVFQQGFSSRALFGLLANDDFTVKVSPDGSTFHTGLVVDKDDGMVSIPEHSKFSASSNFDNYIAADTWTKLSFNTAIHNDQGDFSAASNHFIAPADGFYALGAQINFKENATLPSAIAMKFYVGGTAVAHAEQRYAGTIVSLGTSLSINALLDLTGNDQVDVRVLFSSNDGYVEADTCAFWGCKIA